MFETAWLPDALNELASIWMNSDSESRNLVNSATSDIDWQLQTDPFAASEEREQDERVMFAYPLGVRFEVDTDQKRVWVLHVWRFRKRRK